MKDEISVAEWQRNFLRGKYLPKDRGTQIEAGWYDWFCRDSSLAAKTAKMGRVISQVREGGKVDLSGWYVWFKNNCPCFYPLYDDFRFGDRETGDTRMTISVDCKYRPKKYSVYGTTPDGEGHWDEPMFECDTSKELLAWLNEPWHN